MPRPRLFEEAKVLEAAMACFWRQGYEATSVRELADAMGLSGPSLYNAFGDKRQLYVEALEHYCRTRTYPLLDRIERENAPADALSAFFETVIERTLSDRERRGCFLVNTALEVAPHDRMMSKVVAAHLEAIRGFLLRCLRGMVASGYLQTSSSADEIADQLLAVLLGIRVLARSRPERKLLQGIVASTLTSIRAGHVHPGASTARPRASARKRS